MDNLTVLMVDDDNDFLKLLATTVESQFSADVDTAIDGKSAREHFSNRYDVITLDYSLPDCTGLELLEEINSGEHPPAVIMVTGKGDESIAAESIRLGAFGYVLKNLQISTLLPATIEKAIEHIRSMETREQLSIILDSMSDLVTYQDIDYRMKWSNAAAEGFVDTRPDGLEARFCYDVWHHVDKPCEWCPMGKVHESNTPIEKEVTVEDRTWLVKCYPISNGEVVTNVVEIAQDISEYRRREEDLSAIINIASHELRHPATIFKGYADLLLCYDTIDRKVFDDALRSISQAADRLADLVSKLLNVSNIDRNKFQLSFSESEPKSLLEGAIEIIKRTGMENRINIHVNPGRPVLLDIEKIEQVLVNLIDNAIKFSPELSQVDLWYEQKDGTTYYFVGDAGPGIPEHLREEIFKRFYMVEDSMYHTIPGAGLGLYIAKAIVDAHGGTIQVNERSTGGSVFSFSIPDRNPDEYEAKEIGGHKVKAGETL